MQTHVTCMQRLPWVIAHNVISIEIIVGSMPYKLLLPVIQPGHLTRSVKQL